MIEDINEINAKFKNIKKKKTRIDSEENINNSILNNYKMTSDSVCASESDIDKMFKKNIILNERIAVIDMMLKLYPQLEKDRQYILERILYNAQPKIELYVFDKITIGNKTDYYKDSHGFILDADVNVVGICVQENNISKYLIFEKKINDIKNEGLSLIQKLDKHFNCIHK